MHILFSICRIRSTCVPVGLATPQVHLGKVTFNHVLHLGPLREATRCRKIVFGGVKVSDLPAVDPRYCCTKSPDRRCRRAVDSQLSQEFTEFWDPVTRSLHHSWDLWNPGSPGLLKRVSPSALGAAKARRQWLAHAA